jgi:hypothetical protein
MKPSSLAVHSSQAQVLSSSCLYLALYTTFPGIRGISDCFLHADGVMFTLASAFQAFSAPMIPGRGSCTPSLLFTAPSVPCPPAQGNTRRRRFQTIHGLIAAAQGAVANIWLQWGSQVLAQTRYPVAAAKGAAVTILDDLPRLI